MLTMKVCRSKYYLSLFQNRALAPQQIPASLCERPIYLLLCWVITLLLKSTSWRAPLSFACIIISLHWVWLHWIFYHELQFPVSPWSSEVLYIYVLWSQKGLVRYHFLIPCYDYFEEVLSSEFCYYGPLADYAIDMSNRETYVLLWVWLVHNICWNMNVGFSCLQQQEQTEFVKVFLYHFQFINWIAWGQAKV